MIFNHLDRTEVCAHILIETLDLNAFDAVRGSHPSEEGVRIKIGRKVGNGPYIMVDVEFLDHYIKIYPLIKKIDANGKFIGDISLNEPLLRGKIIMDLSFMVPYEARRIVDYIEKIFNIEDALMYEEDENE